MKKIVSSVLAFLMLFSLALPVFAADGDTVQNNEESMLYHVLAKVKTTIDVPMEFTEFDYYLNTRYGETLWGLYWYTKDYSKSMEVSADSDGNIISYYYYGDAVASGAPAVTKAEAQKAAYDFIEKVAPYVTKNITLTESAVSGKNYRFVFTRVENGIKYSANTVRVYVNYTTGKITNFNLNWENGIEFPVADGIITLDAAKALWKQNADMKLVWDIVEEYDPETYEVISSKAYLVWRNQSSYPNIDAHKGDFVEDYVIWKNDFSVSEDSAEMEASGTNSASKDEIYISPDEQEKIDENSKYITAEAADEALRRIDGLSVNSDFKLSSSRLSRDGKGGASWILTYTGTVTKYEHTVPTVRATLDALTGELISYSAYNNHSEKETSERILKDEDSQALAHSFVQKMLPGYSDILKLEEKSQVTYSYYKEAENLYSAIPYGTSYRYARTYNDIPVEGNNVYITVDEILGKITNFSYNLTEDVEFADKQAPVSKEAAIDSYIEFADIDLAYNAYTVYLYDKEASAPVETVKDEAVILPNYPDAEIETETKIGLDYVFTNVSNGVSAVSGKAVDYECKPIAVTEDIDKEFYSDIAGHWSERIVRLLYDTEILIGGGDFNPNSYITQKEFLTILNNAAYGYGRYTDLESVSFDTVAKYFVNRQVILDEEMNDTAQVTRQTAVKFMIRTLGYGDIAKHHSIFKCDYLDADMIDTENIGYVALAQALGIAQGSEGYFNPTMPLTKAEAAVLIYNYMSSK